MQIFREDVKAGVFIIVASAAFLFAILKVGGTLDQMRSGQRIVLNFDHTSGLAEGNPVQYRGKKVGAVKDINFADLGQSIDVICTIDLDVVLYEGTRARIGDKSVLGGKLVELIPPEYREGLKPLAEGTVIVGDPSAGLDTLLASAQGMMDDYRVRFDSLFVKLESLIDNVDGGVTDVRTQVDSFAELKPDARETLNAYTELAKNLSVKADDLLTDIKSTLEEAKPATVELRDEFVSLAQESKKSLGDITVRLNSLLESGDRTINRADGLMVDNYEELIETIAALKETVRNLEHFSAAIAEKPNRLLFGKPLPPRPEDAEELFDRELRKSGVIERKDGSEDQR